mgnify:CR=1 FL=1
MTYDRDLIGYGDNPPDPKWPDGARIAVNFVLNYEEGSEPSVQDGEGHTEVGLTEAQGLGPGNLCQALRVELFARLLPARRIAEVVPQAVIHCTHCTSPQSLAATKPSSSRRYSSGSSINGA